MAKFPAVNATLSVGGAVNVQLRNASAEGRANIRQAAALEDTNPETAVNYVEYTINGEVYCDATTEDPWFAQVGDTVAVILTTQKSATPSTLFNGSCIVTACSDRQPQGDWETQTITLVSNGAPTTPA